MREHESLCTVPARLNFFLQATRSLLGYRSLSLARPSLSKRCVTTTAPVYQTPNVVDNPPDITYTRHTHVIHLTFQSPSASTELITRSTALRHCAPVAADMGYGMLAHHR